VLLAAGCGGSQPAPPTAHPAKVHVQQEWTAGGLYIEGSYSYVRVESDGTAVTEVRLSDERVPRATIRLEPGTYRLISFQRPCDGNCSNLDPPTDECSHRIEVEPSEELRELVSLSPGEGCTIVEEHRTD
jgi:hypothetical protein